jgi:chromosomal replication initiation ATPase DnaA
VDLSLQLPDLISRLRSVIQINIGDPEEHLMACMMSKLFCDIQLKVKRRVIDYAVKHIERSYRAVIDFVSKADLLSMEGKCNVDIGLAKKILNMHV